MRSGSDEMIYGANAVLEALRSGRRDVHEVYVVRSRSSGARDGVRDLARRGGVPVEEVDGPWMSRRFGSREDQGVAARVQPYPYVEVKDLLARARSPALVLALDQVQDPRNLGAAVRSAVAFGASGVVIHKDRSASVTPAAVKASAGMTEHIDIARATNLARALESASRASIWVRGLDAASSETIHDADLTLPTVLVVGGEDSGLRRLTIERCDSLLSVPLDPRCPSLNAAAAAAVAMAEAARQRQAAP